MENYLSVENLTIGSGQIKLNSSDDIGFITGNEKFMQILGLKCGDSAADTLMLLELMHSEDKNRFDRALRKLNEGKSELRWEGHIFVTNTIKRVFFDITLRTRIGKENLFDVVLLDISHEHRNILESSKASEQKDESRATLEKTAYELTENIPIGTYTMILREGDNLAEFGFMSNRFLEITGLSRQTAQENPLNAFKCVHPEDFEKWVESNARVFKDKTPFKEETRVLIDGKISWIVAESIPRQLQDKTWIWEGVIQDITQQKSAEKALVEAAEKAVENERIQAVIQAREDLLRDIHDGFGNQLAIAKLRLRSGDASPGEVVNILQDCIDDLRLIFDSLDAEEHTLLSTLRKLQHRITQRIKGIPIHIKWDIGAAERADFTARQTLQAARIIQESISNAVKHANHSDIFVSCVATDNQAVSANRVGAMA